MQTIDFKGKKWVIDLDWEILPGDSSVKEESKEIAIKTNCSYGILVDYDSVFAIGLTKKNVKAPSAALYLALANQEIRTQTGELDNYPDWIVVEEIGDDKYWMSVINKGIPSPQYDKIFDITTVKDKITELLINDTYHLYSPCGEIKSIFEGMKYVEEKTLNELTEHVSSKIGFTKLRGIPVAVIYIGLGVLILGGVGIGVSSFMDGYQLKKKAEELRSQQLLEAQKAKAEYIAKLKIYNDQIALSKKQALDTVVFGLSGEPSKVLNSWYDAIGSVSFGDHGWKMGEITCQFSPELINNKSSCKLNFIRNGLSTNRMLLQDYPDAILTGDNAVVTRNLLVDENIFAKPDNSILDSLPDAKHWGFDIISQLQLLKIADIDFEVKPSVNITITPPLKPLSPQEISAGTQPVQEAPMSVGIAQGSLVIKSDNFDLLRELADNVDFKAVGVKNISFKLGDLGSIAWEVTLNYYVKSANGGIAASNSESLSNNAITKEVDKETNGRPGPEPFNGSGSTENNIKQ